MKTKEHFLSADRELIKHVPLADSSDIKSNKDNSCFLWTETMEKGIFADMTQKMHRYLSCLKSSKQNKTVNTELRFRLIISWPKEPAFEQTRNS